MNPLYALEKIWLVVSLGGFAVFLIVLFAGKWNGKSLWYRLWSLITDWETYALERAQEREDERKRLEKRDNRKPGRLTDFE